jgi:outer membrane protein assembly factor BamA
VLTGYSQAFALNYLKPNLNKAQTLGVGLGLLYSRKHELAYATRNDRLVYFDDPATHIFRNFTAIGSLFFRPEIHQSHTLLLQFSQFHFTDTIYSLNPDFYINNHTSPHFLSLEYEFRSDHRNLIYYPTSGYYFDLVISKHGLGFLQNSKLNVLNISSSYKRYLPVQERWFLLTGATAKLSFSSKQPYFMSRSLGYMYDFVRGYEYYVVDGMHAGLLKTNLKYQILKPVVIQLPFIRSEKFSKMHLSLFLGIHSDIGFVYEPETIILRTGYPTVCSGEME